MNKIGINVFFFDAICFSLLSLKGLGLLQHASFAVFLLDTNLLLLERSDGILVCRLMDALASL